MFIRKVLFAIAATMTCAHSAGAEPARPPLTVFAAASLTTVLQQLGEKYTASHGLPVRFSFAASAALARQIEAGAGADVYFSADQQWMDHLEQRGKVQKASRRDVLGNRLVLIAPAASKLQLTIAPGFALARALGTGHLATGDPASVPVGRYARRALTTLGVWNDVSHRLVRAEDVRHAMMFVARGEAPLGIVYETDARVEPRVRVVDTFPASSHGPITYAIALTDVARPEATRFVDFLRGPTGRTAFEKAGFAVLP